MNKIIQGNCLDSLKDLPENSVDAILTDPPYGLSFMGKKWDYDVPSVEIWEECLRVLKPGGYLLAFAGTRTQHRMAVNIEDAGFEIRDMIAWVYGSGFPKSLNIGKAVDTLQGNEREVVGEKRTPDGKTYAERRPNGDITGYRGNGQEKKENTQGIETKGTSEWEGWGTALKPALEPITVARKPLSEKTVAENCLKWGVGGINIDGCRVPHQSEADRLSATPQGKATSNVSAGAAPDVDMSEVDYNGEKYWYKNEYKWLIDKWLNDEDYVWSELKENLETYEWCKVPEINDGDRVLFDSGEGICIRLYESKRKEFDRPDTSLGRFPANLIHDGSDEVVSLFPNTKSVQRTGKRTGKETGIMGAFTGQDNVVMGHNDSGSASRFFYCAKASKSERNKGCEDIDAQVRVRQGLAEEKKDTISSNFHPTVKPIALMEYLVKLVSKEDAIILDPFAGSGTTLVACKNLNRNYIGMELDPEYIKIAEARLNV